MEGGLWPMISRMLETSGGVELAVFFTLVACSIFLWSMVFLKWTDLRVINTNNARFMEAFEKADNFGAVHAATLKAGDSPMCAIFNAAMRALEKRNDAPETAIEAHEFSTRPTGTHEELVLLAMQHTSKAYYARLMSGTPYMATIGTTTPFIGLFGTVWGIMTTFQALGSVKNPSMAVVAPGISSALIATAAGLAVAIPAVITYNWLMTQIDGLQEKSDCFIERMMVLVRVNTEGADADNIGELEEEKDMVIKPSAPAKKVLASTERKF